MDLFKPVAPKDRWHRVFAMLQDPRYLPERKVLEQWAEGFEDRDGKFAFEFQTTFESCMWELYLHAYLKETGSTIDLRHHAPDFVVDGPTKFCMEATIAAPAQGEQSAIGYDPRDIPDDFNAFNSQAAIRIANSLSSKVKKYRSSYSKLAHAQGKPYVIAVAPFDRAFAHFAASRPIIAALYGVHYDEEAARAMGPSASKIPRVEVDSAIKSNGSPVPLGFFADEQNKDVSAVVYSCLATWGKIRALADNPNELSLYQTFHPGDDGITPRIKVTRKCDYHEHLLDGLHVFHNPFAERPLPDDALGHDRIAQFFPVPGGFRTIEPDDFLLMRMVRTFMPTDKAGNPVASPGWPK